MGLNLFSVNGAIIGRKAVEPFWRWSNTV